MTASQQSRDAIDDWEEFLALSVGVSKNGLIQIRPSLENLEGASAVRTDEEFDHPFPTRAFRHRYRFRCYGLALMIT